MMCECEIDAPGCGEICPYDKDMRCSRNPNHLGNHYACGTGFHPIQTHRIYEWCNASGKKESLNKAKEIMMKSMEGENERPTI